MNAFIDWLLRSTDITVIVVGFLTTISTGVFLMAGVVAIAIESPKAMVSLIALATVWGIIFLVKRYRKDNR